MFEQDQKRIIDSLKTPNAAKSWLLVGPHGIGKQEFAKNLVKTLTDDLNEYNPSVQWISCGLTDAAKKEIQKALLAGEQLEDKEWAKKTEITVDDVREGCHFLSLKSNKIKILIFDLADDMNENAQNALLKTLEEPYPNTLILLLCENIGKLKRTILSRCQTLHLNPQTPKDFEKQLLKQHPELSQKELQEIGYLSDYVFGLAEEILNSDGLRMYTHLKELIESKNKTNANELLTFCDQVSKTKETFQLVKILILKYIAHQAKQQTEFSMEKAYLLSELYDKMNVFFNQIESQNLDKKQSLISIIYQVSENL